MFALAGPFPRALSRRVHSHTQPRQPRQPLRDTRHDRYASQRRHASTTPPTDAQKPAAPSAPKPVVAPSNPPQPKSLPAPGPPKDDPIPIANNVSPLPLWQRLGPLTRVADGYARAQRRRPYVTQLCSSLVIALCADLSVQRMMAKGDLAETEPVSATSASGLSTADYRYDPLRTLRSMTIGAISSIPTYRWFMFLSHSFNYSSHILSLAIKVVVNQLCFTPVFNSYFFGMQALLAGETLREALNRVCRTVPISFVNSVKLWPAVTAFSFTFVPMEYRSVFSGVIAVGWQTYLVYLNRQAELQEQKRLRAIAAAATPEATSAATVAPAVSTVLTVSATSAASAASAA